jgi:hypothetical protein
MFDIGLQLSTTSFDAFLPLGGQSGDDLLQCAAHLRS